MLSSSSDCQNHLGVAIAVASDGDRKTAIINKILENTRLAVAAAEAAVIAVETAPPKAAIAPVAATETAPAPVSSINATADTVGSDLQQQRPKNKRKQSKPRRSTDDPHTSASSSSCGEDEYTNTTNHSVVEKRSTASSSNASSAGTFGVGDDFDSDNHVQLIDLTLDDDDDDDGSGLLLESQQQQSAKTATARTSKKKSEPAARRAGRGSPSSASSSSVEVAFVKRVKPPTTTTSRQRQRVPKVKSSTLKRKRNSSSEDDDDDDDDIYKKRYYPHNHHPVIKCKSSSTIITRRSSTSKCKSSTNTTNTTRRNLYPQQQQIHRNQQQQDQAPCAVSFSSQSQVNDCAATVNNNKKNDAPHSAIIVLSSSSSSSSSPSAAAAAPVYSSPSPLSTSSSSPLSPPTAAAAATPWMTLARPLITTSDTRTTTAAEATTSPTSTKHSAARNSRTTKQQQTKTKQQSTNSRSKIIEYDSKIEIGCRCYVNHPDVHDQYNWYWGKIIAMKKRKNKKQKMTATATTTTTDEQRPHPAGHQQQPNNDEKDDDKDEKNDDDTDCASSGDNYEYVNEKGARCSPPPPSSLVTRRHPRWVQLKRQQQQQLLNNEKNNNGGGGGKAATDEQPNAAALEESDFLYSFKFELDGDIVHNIPFGNNYFYTEKQYKDEIGEPEPRPVYQYCDDALEIAMVNLNGRELFKNRCRQCTQCRRHDCGVCSTCVENKTSTGLRRVCLRKMCLKISEENKRQPVPGLLGWYFATCEIAIVSKMLRGKVAPLNKDLSCIYFVEPSTGKRFRGIETILAEINTLTTIAQEKRVNEFYTKMFGTPIVAPIQHMLLNKSYCHEWIGASDEIIQVYGKVVKCERNYGEAEYYFTVEFDEESRSAVNTRLFAQVDMCVPKQRRVSEHQAFGGCLLFDRSAKDRDAIVCPILDLEIVPDYTLQWLVPMRIASQPSSTPAEAFLNKTPLYPRRTLTFRGYEILLEVAPSSIPNAGLGVFASCKALVQHDDFVLQPGELLDLGLYAPMRATDRKLEHISFLKNFLLSGKAQSWHFEVHPFDRDRLPCVFDFTNDLTGDVQDWIRDSVVPYVNETNGREIPTVHADYDPSGGVHYLLGHVQGRPFRLPKSGEKLEIKVDYGAKYEKVRVACGYPRVCPRIQKCLEQENETEDIDYIKDIQYANAQQMIDNVSFLETFLPQLKYLNATTRERIFLAGVCFVTRTKRIMEEVKDARKDDICDNGYSQLKSATLFTRVRNILLKTASTWGSEEDALPDVLLECMLSNDLYKTAWGIIFENPVELTHAELKSKLIDLSGKVSEFE